MKHYFEVTLIEMEPQNMVYVDLNSIMHANAKYLAEWHDRLGNRVSSTYYRKIANDLLDAIEEVRYKISPFFLSWSLKEYPCVIMSSFHSRLGALE